MRPLRSLAYFWTIGLAIAVTLLALSFVVRLVLPRADWRERPSVVSMAPANGTNDVLPGSSIRISFSQPMNRRSVQTALHIQPATANQGSFTWLNQGRDLVFTPARELQAGQTYTVTVRSTAQNIWWQPLAEPLRLAFRTVEPPVILAAFPTGDAVATDTALALVFNQPMVPASELGRPVAIDALRFDPPFENRNRWIADDTLLVQPLQALQPDTAYRAELSARLQDVRGTELGRDFAWSWHTQAPLVIKQSPAPGARWVAPDQPLVLMLSQPLPLSTLRQALDIQPAVTGRLETATTISGTQVLTFTADAGWQAGDTYQVAFSAVNQAGSDLPTDWQFTVEPQPALLGQFPGQNQVLPRGQSLRLIFNTPINEESLRAGLRLDPPVDQFDIRVNESEARILADLQASNTYTLTISADITSRNGTSLGQESVLRFRTAAAAPQLGLPALEGRVLRLPEGPAPELLVEHTNLSGLQLSLFELDEPTLVRALNFSADEWRNFLPERYGRRLLRLWRIELNAQPDQTVRRALPIEAATGSDLAPGSYYLRITTPEGPRADLVLLVSPISLAMLQSENHLLIWAFDEQNGTPVADLPLTLYRREAVVERGQSNADGLWQLRLPGGNRDAPFLAIAGGSAPSLVNSQAVAAATAGRESLAGDHYRAMLFAEYSRYAPGDTIAAHGFIRRFLESGRMAYPLDTLALELELVDLAGQPVVGPARITIQPGGLFTGRLSLPDDLRPGVYRLQLGHSSVLDSIWMNIANPQTDLDFVVQADTDPARLRLRTTVDGRPIGGIAVDWQIHAFALAPPDAPDGFHFGSGEEPNHAAPMISGQGLSDPQGWLELPLEDLAAGDYGTRLAIETSLQDSSAPPQRVGRLSLVPPTGTLVGVRASSQVLRSEEEVSIEILALNGDGTPAAGRSINLAMDRRVLNDAGEISETRWIDRTLNSNDQGRAASGSLRLEPGVYRVEVSSASHRSSMTIVVTGPDFVAWPNQNTELRLALDMDEYNEGATAQLLPTSPFTRSTVLLALDRGRPLSTTTANLQAGEVITLSAEPALAPITAAGIVVGRNSDGSPGSGLRAAATWLTVHDDDPGLITDIRSNRTSYLPGQTAALTITASRGDGRPAAANLVVALYARDDAAGSAGRLDRLSLPPLGPPLHIALSPGIGSKQQPDPPQHEAETGTATGPAMLTRLVRTGDDGRLVLHLQLPATDNGWRVAVYASGAVNRLGQASLDMRNSSVLSAFPIVPDVLRPGDVPQLALETRNESTDPISAGVRLQVSNANLNTAAMQRGSIAADEERIFAWPVQPDHQAGIDVRFSYGMTATEQHWRRTVPLIDPVFQPVESAGFRSTTTFSSSIEVDTTLENTRLLLAVAAGSRAAVALAADELASIAEPHLLDRAGLLMLSSRLAMDAPPAERMHWQQLIRRERAMLEHDRNADAGWGWRPGDHSRALPTAFAIEALLKHQAILGQEHADLADSIERLADLLENERDPDLRSYLWYVLRLADAAEPETGRTLLDAEPGPGGLAYLALALPDEQANIALERLIRMAEPADNGTSALIWQSETGSPIGGPLSLNATAALALHKLRPTSPLLPEIRQTLLTYWGVGGWPAASDSVRAAELLLATSQDDRLEDSIVLRLNGQELGRISSDQPYLDLSVAAPLLTESNRLELLPDSAASRRILFIAYRIEQHGRAAPVPHSADRLLAVTHNYVDPQTNRLLDPADLRPGQLVRCRLTLVVYHPLAALDLESDLPAAMRFVTAEAIAPFFQYTYNTPTPPARVAAEGQATSHRLRFSAAELAAGIYTQSYLLRVQAAGEYTTPPPRATPLLEPNRAGIGQTVRSEIKLP